MTDKEFKRLGRPQLIDIIYQLQLQVDQLTEQKQQLEKALEDKRFRISNAGNIAEAALEINGYLRSVQDAAEQYLSEIKLLHEEAIAERDTILANARAEAAAIISSAKTSQVDYDSAIEAILEEYRQNHSDDGEQDEA